MNYIDQIVNYIIRPVRDIYKPKRLGNVNFCVYQQNGEPLQIYRQDRAILNKQGETIHLSYYECKNNQQTFSEEQKQSTYHSNIFQYKNNQLVDQFHARNNQKNCVVYLHANNGSRIQGMTYLKKILQAKLNVCLFDCSGSGISQGQYVTLGLKESKDLQCVINYLTKQKGITQVALWGRSMGASTAIIYSSKGKGPIKSLILDSPFKDVQKLIKQIAADRTGLPKIFFNPIIPFIRNQIRIKTGYSIQDLKMKKYLNLKTTSQGIKSSQNEQFKNPLQYIPALFLVSKNDKLVKVHHGQKLFKRYPCSDKLIEYIQNQHHQTRKAQIIQKCIHFIIRCFKNDQLRNLSEMSSSTSKLLSNDIPILNFKKQLNGNRNFYKHQEQKTQNRTINNYNTQSSSSKRDNVLKKQWNQNLNENHLNMQNQKQLSYDNNTNISQEQFYRRMKTGLTNLCRPIENCQKSIQRFQQERKMMRNSSSMSNLISQQDHYHKIVPIRLSFVKKHKSKTSYIDNTQPKHEDNHYINSKVISRNMISPQRNMIHQYRSNDPIKQKQQRNQNSQSQSRGKKISMSRQASRSKRFNFINQQTPIIPQQRIQLEPNNISISIDKSRKIPFIWSLQNRNNFNNYSEQLRKNNSHLHSNQYSNQQQFQRKNEYNNTDRQYNNNSHFNNKSSFHQQNQKEYNNISLPSPPSTTTKMIQFQNSRKKISLSTTLQSIQMSNPTSMLQNNNQIQQKQGQYIKADNYYKNYQNVINSFSPKRMFK